MTTERTCIHPDGCDSPVHARGWCRLHYRRICETGEPGQLTSLRQSPYRPCAVDDCEKIVGQSGAHGMCIMHYRRWRAHGDPHVVGQGGASLPGELNPNWSGDAVTYTAAHLRLRSQRGPASEQTCHDCGEPAAHWSYNHLDPAERIGPFGGRYSADPSFYEPRCVRCHSAFDRASRALLVGERP